MALCQSPLPRGGSKKVKRSNFKINYGRATCARSKLRRNFDSTTSENFPVKIFLQTIDAPILYLILDAYFEITKQNHN